MALGPKQGRAASAGVLPAVAPVNKKKRGKPTTPDENDVTQAAARPAAKKPRGARQVVKPSATSTTQDENNVTQDENIVTQAAARPATKKPRVARQVVKPSAPASSKRYADVVAALQEDDSLEQGVREMLVNGFGESLLASSPTNLHSFQFQFLGFVEEALGRIEAKFGANLADAQDAYDKLANAGKEFEQAQQSASVEFGASAEALKVEEAAVESSGAAVDVAKGSVTVVEARLGVSDLAIGTASMERHQLEVILNDPSSAPVALLARLVPDCAEDSGLTFDDLVGKVREAIALRDRTVQDVAAARVALHTTLEDARTAHGSAERNLSDRRKALDDVSAIRYEKAKRLKNTWDRLRNLPEEQARTEAELKAAKKKLGDFQAGPVTTVRTMRPGDHGARSHGAPSLTPAEIRRRRSSFLPRKVIAMRSKASSLASNRPSTDDDDSDGDVATAQVSGKGQKDAAAPGESRNASTIEQRDLDGEDEQESIEARLPAPSRRSLGTKE